MTLSRSLQAAFVAVAALLGGTGAYAQEVVLRYSSWLPQAYWSNVDIMNPWFAEIERVTEGRVRVETLPKVVGTPQSQLEVIADGLADIAFIVPGYTAGRFPVLNMAELPFFGTDEARHVAPAFHRTYAEHMAGFDEFAGTRLMAVWANGSGQVFTARNAVATTDDFAGLKLRVPGPVTAKALELLGGVPVAKPATEIYEMLSTGVIDGMMNQFNSASGTKAIELIDHVTLFEGGLFHSALAIVVNPAAWDRISPADQAAIEAISGEALAARAGIAHDKVDGAVLEEIRTAGRIQIHTAPAEMLAELSRKLSPLEQNWIDGAKAAGLEDPAAVLAAFRADVRRRVGE